MTRVVTGTQQPPSSPRLDRGTRALVLALPLAFLAHDVGEVRGNDELNAALSATLPTLPGLRRLPAARRMAGSAMTSRRQMAVAVAGLTGALAAVSARAAVRPPGSSATGDFAVVAGVVGGHVLGHVGQSFAVGRPTPGLAGGLLVTLPYSVVTLTRLRRRGYLPARLVGRDAVRSALAVPPLLFGLRVLARRLV